MDVSRTVGVEAGTVLNATFFSETLQRQLPYRVYLPPGYDSTTERYPVVYLLHGGGGGFAEWTDLDHIGLSADAMITEGRIRPMILVMPDGCHWNSYWREILHCAQDDKAVDWSLTEYWRAARELRLGSISPLDPRARR